MTGWRPRWWRPRRARVEVVRAVEVVESGYEPGLANEYDPDEPREAVGEPRRIEERPGE